MGVSNASDSKALRTLKFTPKLTKMVYGIEHMFRKLNKWFRRNFDKIGNFRILDSIFECFTIRSVFENFSKKSKIPAMQILTMYNFRIV